MATLYSVLAFTFGFVCIFMMLLILIQKGRGGGLSSAFGGAGGNTAFGTKTGDLLTWVTSIVFAIFLLLSMGLTWTADYVSSRGMAVVTPAVPEDDPLAPAPRQLGEAEDLEVIPPTDPRSSLPPGVLTPDPGLRPDADGTPPTGTPEHSPPREQPPMEPPSQPDDQ